MIVTGSGQSSGYTGVAETNASQNFIKFVYLNKNKSRSRFYHASKKKNKKQKNLACVIGPVVQKTESCRFQWEGISNEDVTNTQIAKPFWPRTSFLPNTEYFNLIFNSNYCVTSSIMILITPSTIIWAPCHVYWNTGNYICGNIMDCGLPISISPKNNTVLLSSMFPCQLPIFTWILNIRESYIDK